jgi:hypothetical protein
MEAIEFTKLNLDNIRGKVDLEHVAKKNDVEVPSEFKTTPTKLRKFLKEKQEEMKQRQEDVPESSSKVKKEQDVATPQETQRKSKRKQSFDEELERQSILILHSTI